MLYKKTAQLPGCLDRAELEKQLKLYDEADQEKASKIRAQLKEVFGDYFEEFFHNSNKSIPYDPFAHYTRVSRLYVEITERNTSDDKVWYVYDPEIGSLKLTNSGASLSPGERVKLTIKGTHVWGQAQAGFEYIKTYLVLVNENGKAKIEDVKKIIGRL